MAVELRETQQRTRKEVLPDGQATDYNTAPSIQDLLVTTLGFPIPSRNVSLLFSRIEPLIPVPETEIIDRAKQKYAERFGTDIENYLEALRCLRLERFLDAYPDLVFGIGKKKELRRLRKPHPDFIEKGREAAKNIR